MNIKQRITTFAAMMVLAIPAVGQHEGEKLKAYLDGGGVPTIGKGETEGVKLGDEISKEGSDYLFTWRLGMMGWAVDGMVDVEMTPETWAALTSWTYNVGIAAAQKSTVIKLMNQGRQREACQALVYKNTKGQWAGWVFDNGQFVRGLLNRRQKEQALCLKGVR